MYLITIGDVKEVRILGGHLGPHCWPKAIEMVASNRLPLDDIITHTYPLKEFEKGIKMVMQSANSIKVMLIPWMTEWYSLIELQITKKLASCWWLILSSILLITRLSKKNWFFMDSRFRLYWVVWAKSSLIC